MFGRGLCIVSRTVVARAPWRLAAHPLRIQAHNFHAFSPNLAKAKKLKSATNKKGKKAEEEPVEEEEDISDLINIQETTQKFDKVIESFTKIANEIKLGKTNPAIFDKLIIHTHDGDQQFTSVAQTTVKGRKFVVTVFDPSHTKNIINAVLDSDLNMNPQVDPNSNQTLNVPLPPVTTESKKENVKNLKLTFEKFKNGSGTKASSSLSTIRTDIKNKISKKKKKLSDGEQKVVNDFEKLHKSYIDKLNDVFKASEKAIMK